MIDKDACFLAAGSDAEINPQLETLPIAYYTSSVYIILAALALISRA
jgi:hypothetical protein